MSHTLVALVQDHPGVLTRVVGLVRRRGFNIESLAVGHCETPGVSRITMVIESGNVEQIVKQLYRLIEVLKVTDVTARPTVERELALVKVHVPPARRAELFGLIDVCGGKVAHVGPAAVVVEVHGTPGRVDDVIEVLRPFGLKELTRSHVVMVHGHEAAGERNGEHSQRSSRAADGTAAEPTSPV